MVGERGKLKWVENWMTFFESMLQLHLLRVPKQRHYSITHIQKVIVDPRKHIDNIYSDITDLGISVSACPEVDVIKSGGVEFGGIKSTLVSVRSPHREPTIQYYTFVPHESECV